MFGTQAYHLYISRFLNGFVGGGAQISISLFVAEIADNKLVTKIFKMLKLELIFVPFSIRGRLGTYLQYSRNIGILLAYLLGFHLDYTKSSIVFTVITLIFCATFHFFPSTPQYYLENENSEVFTFTNVHSYLSLNMNFIIRIICRKLKSHSDIIKGKKVETIPLLI